MQQSFSWEIQTTSECAFSCTELNPNTQWNDANGALLLVLLVGICTADFEFEKCLLSQDLYLN